MGSLIRWNEEDHCDNGDGLYDLVSELATELETAVDLEKAALISSYIQRAFDRGLRLGLSTSIAIDQTIEGFTN